MRLTDPGYVGGQILLEEVLQEDSASIICHGTEIVTSHYESRSLRLYQCATDLRLSP